MKHPHCNRSHAAHLFWCRGFAPVVFIFAIALIVVSIGSGVYFAIEKKTAQAPSPEDIASIIPNALSGEATSTSDIATTTALAVTSSDAPTVAVASPAPTTKVAVAPTKPVIATVNCGSDNNIAPQCLTEHIKTCTPAKGVVVDANTGLRVERIIDGYKGDKCSYRSNIISGEGDFALLAGMDINCMLPKATLAATVQDGVMSQEDLFAYCSGSFMDLMREQMGQ